MRVVLKSTVVRVYSSMLAPQFGQNTAKGGTSTPQCGQNLAFPGASIFIATFAFSSSGTTNFSSFGFFLFIPAPSPSSLIQVNIFSRIFALSNLFRKDLENSMTLLTKIILPFPKSLTASIGNDLIPSCTLPSCCHSGIRFARNHGAWTLKIPEVMGCRVKSVTNFEFIPNHSMPISRAKVVL